MRQNIALILKGLMLFSSEAFIAVKMDLAPRNARLAFVEGTMISTGQRLGCMLR